MNLFLVKCIPSVLNKKRILYQGLNESSAVANKSLEIHMIWRIAYP